MADNILIKPATGEGTVSVRAKDVSGQLHSIVIPADDAGNLYKPNAITQNVALSANNNASTTLGAGLTWTGTGESSATVAGLQVNFEADQNCTIYVEQSQDNVTWLISDEFEYVYGTGFSTTVQATASYFRVRFTNNGAATTTFKLQSMLCPTVESLPRALDDHGHLKVGIKSIADAYGFEAECTPTGELRTVVPYRLVGTVFSGSTLDTNFWTASTGTGGTATVANAQVSLGTGSTANNTVSLQSTRTARYVGASANRYRAVIQIPVVSGAGVANNVRRWGVFNTTDGAFFELANDGSGNATFKVVTRKGGVGTAVTAFNGVLGTTYALPTTVLTYEIYWTNSKVWFVIGDEILHLVTASSTTWSDTMHHPVRCENNNSGGATNNVLLDVRVATICRLGAAETDSTTKFTTGTQAGVLCKVGPGKIKCIVLSNILNNCIVTFFDGVTATGTTIWSSGTILVAVGNNPGIVTISPSIGWNFYTGLTYTVTGAACNCLVETE